MAFEASRTDTPNSSPNTNTMDLLIFIAVIINVTRATIKLIIIAMNFRCVCVWVRVWILWNDKQSKNVVSIVCRRSARVAIVALLSVIERSRTFHVRVIQCTNKKKKKKKRILSEILLHNPFHLMSSGATAPLDYGQKSGFRVAVFFVGGYSAGAVNCRVYHFPANEWTSARKLYT